MTWTKLFDNPRNPYPDWVENEDFLSTGSEGVLVEVRYTSRAARWLEKQTGKLETHLAVRRAHTTDRPNTTSTVLANVRVVQVNKRDSSQAKVAPI